MELFLIYLVTRLSELKGALASIEVLAGILLLMTVLLRVGNEFLTNPSTREASPEEDRMTTDVFMYQGIKRSTKRGLWIFTPVFVLCFVANLLLPTTRDAVVIAGGYGLVEAVKNERVQQWFNKSARIASQWLDAQLNPVEEPEAKSGKSTKQEK